MPGVCYDRIVLAILFLLFEHRANKYTPNYLHHTVISGCWYCDVQTWACCVQHCVQKFRRHRCFVTGCQAVQMSPPPPQAVATGHSAQLRLGTFFNSKYQLLSISGKTGAVLSSEICPEALPYFFIWRTNTSKHSRKHTWVLPGPSL